MSNTFLGSLWKMLNTDLLGLKCRQLNQSASQTILHFSEGSTMNSCVIVAAGCQLWDLPACTLWIVFALTSWKSFSKMRRNQLNIVVRTFVIITQTWTTSKVDFKAENFGLRTQENHVFILQMLALKICGCSSTIHFFCVFVFLCCCFCCFFFTVWANQIQIGGSDFSAMGFCLRSC